MIIDKDKKRSKLNREFNKILKQIPEDKKPIGASLIKELTFIIMTMDDLKDHIERDGTVSLFKQGKQEFMRESPALKAYNTTVQRYSLLYKQLDGLLPKESQNANNSPLHEFIKGA